MSSKYGPLHPKMQAMQAQKRDLDVKITQEVNRLAASAANDVMVARAHLNSLQGSLGGTEGTARTQNMARVQLQALESNAASTRTMYEAFVQRLRQSQNLDECADARKAASSAGAGAAASQRAPSALLIVGASIPLGMLLGLLAALVVEKLGPMLPVRVNGAPRGALQTTMAPAFMPVPAPCAKAPRPKAATASPARCLAAAVAVWNGPPILGEINDSAAAARRRFRAGLSGQQIFPRHGRPGAPAGSPARSRGRRRGHRGADLGRQWRKPQRHRREPGARRASKMGKKAILVDCAPQRLATRAIKRVHQERAL